MAAIHYLHDEVAVVGWSCRLPGTKTVPDLWSLLLEGRCAISQVPSDRFPLLRYGHPRRNERGKSYTWAAGILDDVWGFDPSVFGISPREAQQMDPQQRLLLQLAWEALEDAGIRPSAIAGTDVGVFVGASQTDYAHAIGGDQAMANSHFATGNALAVLANRISYVYDLHGPSITFDTACSSSLVALHHATEALRNGRVEMAIVGGINIIASPAQFVTFSQASMLSPTGLCRSFSADADGYVRAEGGIVLVLRRGIPNSGQVHGIILASDVNSDGRTNGISLPSAKAQEELLHRVYSRAGIDPERLSFVEAHGTGTPVGDPIEANALGRALGQTRPTPLPIGSIKTNIGHLEPASGLAGLLKAFLALNHHILPRSVNFREPNPSIDFAQLNLTVCEEPLLLSDTGQNCAGVSSFGFGGTNAHVVIAPGREPQDPTSRRPAGGGDIFAISAASKPALVALARNYSERLLHVSDRDIAITASAIAHHRDFLANRLVVSTKRRGEVLEALDAFVAGAEHPQLESGLAIGKELPIAFVYSGNGSPWVGMGFSAYHHNAAFRAHFDSVDLHFSEIGGWSLKEALFNEGLGGRLAYTHVAQPLIFAIQSAITASLKACGLRPSAVIGHSVGEVAAAEAAGILDLRTAVEVIHFRSAHQEKVRGLGRMAAVLASPEIVHDLVNGIADIEVAARNNPRATTLAGSTEAMAKLKRTAEERGIAFLDLELEYPFHTRFMAPIEAPLITDLRHIRPRNEAVPFVSTVSGSCMAGSRLDADYWWHNIREPVQFLKGIREVAKLGARFFIEIGPRATLLKHIETSLASDADGIVTMSVLDRNGSDRDPVGKVVSKALISGAQLDMTTIFGSDPGSKPALPNYPWQQQQFRFEPTSEAIGFIESERHAFSGVRYSRDALEWYSHIDTVLFPALVDHRIGDLVIFPGTGFVEIALAVARAWLRTNDARIADCEILKPLDLTNGETREVMSRISPNSNTLEISSRPRLSEAGWLLHCRCKILHGKTKQHEPRLPVGQKRRRFDSDMIYRMAEASGLRYGAAFRLLNHAVVVDDTSIQVELESSSYKDNFVLDPIRLDACTHGLLTLYEQLHAPDRGISYIPVRVDEAALLVVGGTPQSATIEVLNKGDRSILANFYFFGPERQLLAVLHRVRCQAIQVRRSGTLAASAFVELPQLIDGSIIGMSGPARDSVAFVEYARRDGLLAEKTTSASESELLIEGAATAAAYEIATSLADAGSIDLVSLIGCGRVPVKLGRWLERLLESLEAAHLVKRRDDQWLVVKDALMPPTASVIRELAAQHSERAAEILVLAAVAGLAEQLQGSSNSTWPQLTLPVSVLDFYDLASVSLRESSTVIERLLGEDALWPKGRALRVLQIGYGPLTQFLIALHHRRDIALTVIEPNRRRFGSAEGLLVKHGHIALIDSDEITAAGKFDLIVAVEALHRLPEGIGPIALRQVLAPRGVLLAIEPTPSLLREFLLELELTDNAGQTVNAYGQRRPEEWPYVLENAGFVGVEAHAVLRGLTWLIVAEADGVETKGASGGSTSVSHPVMQSTLVLDSSRSTSDLGPMLSGSLRQRGVAAAFSHTLDFSDSAPTMVVHILDLNTTASSAVSHLTECCLEMKACAKQFGSKRTNIWFVFQNALANDAGTINPLAAAAWSFSRTLANEFPLLDVRRIDLAMPDGPNDAAECLCDIILSGTPETELQFDGKVLRAVRVNAVKHVLDRFPVPTASAMRLQRHAGAGQRYQWEAMERTAPGAHEVEIAIAATGLNFRDLMWMLSLLPDDMMEIGVADPTFGCECAGEILRVGIDVRHLRPGDRVAAFAAAAFATHVTVSANQVAKLPPAISYESGATIPVAFATAYYSLVTQAKLKSREWVLIHGGAGGVGLAAIQIALARNARVIATAGSDAKRSLLKSLGVHHVLDSRSTSFVEDIRTVTGNGVDVVLNSLAGEAMERSINCLREFGRFVELGKRDYVSNTHIGLRPFRNNITYFGVDLAALMANKKNIARKLYMEIMKQLESGVLTPLPYSLFRACDLDEAFQLMQHSGHIGKIVVQPPPAESIKQPYMPFTVSSVNTHVITGGFGGFGLETAKWLVGRGARYLVLVGRRGAVTEEAKAVVAELSARGVKIHSEPCDIGDRRALEKLFENIRAEMPPLAGIIHAAMVLDDGLLSDLDEERFRRVLEPKIEGVENLDYITRGMPLDYFVLFSSVVTLIGNPGQANYVAANAYMEGVARRRRQEGRTALAIGWGPISDVGVVARTEALRSRFEKLIGVRGMRAAQALDLMAQALELPLISDLAVMTITPSEGRFTADRLQVLKSPTYANFIRKFQADEETATSLVDLHAIAKAQGIDAARHALTAILVTQLARVLHAREEEVSRIRPVGEIGLDSLMGLEFAMSLEETFGIQIALTSSIGTFTVSGLVNEILSQLNLESNEESVMVKSVAERHLDKVEPLQLALLQEFAGEVTQKLKGVRS